MLQSHEIAELQAFAYEREQVMENNYIRNQRAIQENKEMEQVAEDVEMQSVRTETEKRFVMQVSLHSY